MFASFFPKPKWFFLSGAVLGIISMIIWYYFRKDIGLAIGFPFLPDDTQPQVGWSFFYTNNFIVFYLYFGLIAGLWALFWMFYAPHKWQNWSVLVTIFIVFTTFISVQFSVLITAWYRQLYDLMQFAMSGEQEVSVADLMAEVFNYLWLAVPLVMIFVIQGFIVSHYIFRWRMAMTDYYTAKWQNVRHIEGASQRIQEDTMRFASTMEPLGSKALDAVMTLFAFLPVLSQLSEYVPALPIVGTIPNSLVFAAIFWALFGTALMFFVGIKLPGLEFKNQRVEAAYRKELVYGEDDVSRGQPKKLSELFGGVRKNYFKLYFHYTYFNVIRGAYNRFDLVYSMIILFPAMVAQRITLGLYQQISASFSQVSSSFQYLVGSWPTIVELLSIYKRLKSFEAAIDGEELVKLDQEYQGAEE